MAGLTGTRPSWICPACGTPHLPVGADLRLPGLDIYRCSCGLGYSGLAVSGITGESYDAEYYRHVRYAAEAGRASYTAHLAGIFGKCMKECPPPAGGRRLLDVGCATGDFIRWALNHGWDAEGVDTSLSAVGIAQSRGIPARVGALPDLADQAGRLYDVITMWDVLEHLSDPVRALASLRRISAPGGILVLKTVSRTSIIEAMARLLYRASFGVIEAPLRRMYVPGHLYYFTSAVLHRLLAQTGWAVTCAGQADTPARALTGSPLLGAGLALAAQVQHATGRCYELFAAGRKSGEA